jgi:putative ABC transport system permease protein
MSGTRRVLARLRNLVGRGRAEQEMEREMAAHLALIEDDYMRRGMTRGQARREARRSFGNVSVAKEGVRDMWSWISIERLQQDIRYALRGLRRNPGFALMAVITLGLGISVNTAIFSALDAIVLHPLPYPEASRLVRVWSSMLEHGAPHASSTLPDFRDLKDKNRTLADLAAYTDVDFNLTGQGQPVRLHGTAASASFFTVFGVHPLIGVPYSEEAENWGCHRVVVLSEALWRRQFGADPTLIGRTILLDDQPYVVFGVMPVWFAYPDSSVELWTPTAYAPGDPASDRTGYFFDMVGRLKPGATLAQCRSDLGALMPQINPVLGAAADSLQESIVGDIRPTMLLLAAAVLLVLLVACANVANLLLARATARHKEISVRAALGASRARLAQQMLTESVLLALLGGACGLLLSALFLRLIRVWAPASIPRVNEVGINYQVLFFTAALSLVTGLGFGFFPALRASKTHLGDALKESARGASSSLRNASARSLLVIAEISLCLALLIGGGLLILSLVRIQQVDPGFHAKNVLTLRIDLPKTGYSEPRRDWNFSDELLDKLRALPGVEAAGATSVLPFATGPRARLMTIEGRPSPKSFADVPIVNFREISPDYLRALGITLDRGRAFTDQDSPDQPGAVIINETLAHKFWPDSEPIGARLYVGPPEEMIHAKPGTFPRLTVVGVVADLHDNSLDTEIRPAMYIPYSQAGDTTSNSLYFAIRTAAAGPLSYEPLAEKAVHEIDLNLPVSDVRVMEDRVRDSLSQRSFTMSLLCLFALSALVLAAVGTYGVISYSVSQRTQEMGVRIALGAKAGDVVALVLRQAVRLSIIGISLGLLLGIALAEIAKNFLFGVKATNPLVYAGTALLLLIITMAASYIPARRAARSDPMQALRYE